MTIKLCWSCKEKLAAAGYELTEIPESGTQRGICAFCRNGGYFSSYEAEKKKRREKKNEAETNR